MGRKGTRNSRKRAAYLFTVLSVGFIATAISYKKFSLDSREQRLSQQKQELESQLQGLTEENERIKDYENYVKSPKYIEDTARNKMGLAYPDEIIFMPETNK